jgi:hypothetical protein
MLDPKFKARWVKALRSGEFKQARERLASPSGYCCLGVACQIEGIDFDPDEIWPPSTFSSIHNLERKPPNSGTFLTARSFLAHLNDSGKPFSEIADYIEANL